MSSDSKAVFLSYASQDAEAARRLREALCAAGVEVWFDQNELVGGDAWDAKIRRQIAECALFVPVISANTQARREGYFRLEWRLAVERMRHMDDDLPFLVPVVIDDTRDAEAFVPEKFRDVQWTRLPGGAVSQTFCECMKALLASGVADSGPRSSSSPAKAFALPGGPSPTRWAVAALIGVAAIGALALWQPWRIANHSGSGGHAPTRGKLTQAVTDAQRLVAQARQVYEEGDELNRENLFLAEDLVNKALNLDSAEPSAWELGAWLSYQMAWHHIDHSDARRELLHRQAARAHALAPQSVSAHLVLLNTRMSGNSSASTEAQKRDLLEIERELTALAKRDPGNWQVERARGMLFRFQGRPEESIATLRRALELSGGDPRASSDLANVLERQKRLDDSEAAVAAGLARKRTGRLLAYDVFTKSRWRGDLHGARAALASWPGWLLQEDRGVFVAWQAYFWSRQPDKALNLALRFPRDYLHDAFFAGPRAVLTARAHEMAGHAEAAAADWRVVVQIADRELAVTPDAPAALYWKGWALARLGNASAAQEICALLLQRNRNAQAFFFKGTNLAPLVLTAGLTVAALADVQTQIATFNDGNTLTRAVLELDPAYDPVRADPRFQALVASAPAPQKNLLPAQPDTEAKSVAVLAFDNLSDDKANEYFSDGISEELINTLGQVPGLTVKGRTSAFFFKGRKNVTSAEIAQQLGVTYLVRGGVRKSGGKVRITAQLTRAATDEIVWSSEPFERQVEDAFAVQAEIAGLIAQNLQLKLSATGRAPAIHAEAYQLYLEGRELWRHRTMEGYRQAEKLFQRAVALAPDFARGYVGLADVWMIRGLDEAAIGGFGQKDSPLVRQIAGQIERALEIDPGLAEAHTTLGNIRWIEWKFDEAIRELRLAIALNPNYATAHHWMGRVRLSNGELEEALTALRRAHELEPLSSRIADNYSRALLDAQRYAESVALAGRALELQPDSRQALNFKALGLSELGRHEEAVATIRRLDKDYSETSGYVIHVLARAGLRDEADRRLAAAVAKDVSRRYLMLPLLTLNRYDEFFAALQPELLTSPGLDALYFRPAFDAVRRDERFVGLLEKLGVTAAHERAQNWRAAHPPGKAGSKQ